MMIVKIAVKASIQLRQSILRYIWPLVFFLISQIIRSNHENVGWLF